MIHVERGDPPKILIRLAEKWRQALLSARTEGERRRAEKKYGHSDVKAALNQLFLGKCAYCESKITHVDYGHIEHFRPKRGPRARPDLTFEWTNLFLACGKCNGAEFKGDKFPEPQQGGPPVNPCDDDPNEHLDFHYDPIAQLASVYALTRRGEITESLFGLNRRELRTYRSQVVRKLVALARLAQADPEAAELLQSATQSDAEYAAFARTLVK